MEWELDLFKRWLYFSWCGSGKETPLVSSCVGTCYDSDLFACAS